MLRRYIDADALLSNLPDDLPYKASVKRVLMQAPTADVVPRSEVEALIIQRNAWFLTAERCAEMLREERNKNMEGRAKDET